MSICPKCQHVHVAGDVTVINRFDPDFDTYYRTPDGAVWVSRESAQDWLCRLRVRAAS